MTYKVCKFGVIFHIFIISCLCSRFHVRNQWFFYSVITFSYTKCFVHSYTVDVVFTLSYAVVYAMNNTYWHTNASDTYPAHKTSVKSKLYLRNCSTRQLVDIYEITCKSNFSVQEILTGQRIAVVQYFINLWRYCAHMRNVVSKERSITSRG